MTWNIFATDLALSCGWAHTRGKWGVRRLVKRPWRHPYAHYLDLRAWLVERIETLYNRDDPSAVTGVPTGFADLDEKTSGFQPGDLIIIAGRPSMGKTALALNITEHVALDAKMPVAVFSM